MKLLDSRIVRFQFKRHGLVHLATCHDDNDSGYHVTSGHTICGKAIRIGQGGWGYDPKKCTACWTEAAPAERIRY